MISAITKETARWLLSVLGMGVWVVFWFCLIAFLAHGCANEHTAEEILSGPTARYELELDDLRCPSDTILVVERRVGRIVRWGCISRYNDL